MPDYDALAATAHRLLTGAGRTITIRLAGTPVDPLKPWLGMTPGTEINVKATFSRYQRNLVDGTRIQQGDSRCFVAALGLLVDLSTAETVIDGARTLAVVDVLKVQPGDVPISYEIQLR